ncbi:MAG: 7-cyano-7-deazaguanine synthase, partial [Muribaculaceae bacterium]|nr:7-cyano-7-deazaguanine synthase [Muribaculaceae bacterium]
MTSKFLEKVRKTIEKYRLPEPEEGPVIVALSGGPDSVALLDVLVGLGYSVIAAHCNFHLRGDESNRDMAFATDLCRHMGIVCETISFDVESRRKLTGESVEMACRELRYEWFGTLVEKYGASALATGHHR